MRKQKGVSYLHKSAQDTVIEWLREAAERVGHDEQASFGPISWRVNRPAPTWGVFAEYPIIECMCDEHVPAWDEYPMWPMRAPKVVKEGILPTLAELSRAGAPPLAIVDIAIQHKGVISDVIEIVHTHDLTAKKVALLSDRARVRVWRVDAQWVLRQTAEPQEFPEEHFRRVEFAEKMDELFKRWRDAGRPETGTLWESVVAAMTYTLSPGERKTFSTLPASVQKTILRVHVERRWPGSEFYGHE